MPEDLSPLSQGINLIPLQADSPQKKQKAVSLSLRASRYAVMGVAVITTLMLGYKYYVSNNVSNDLAVIEANIAQIQDQEVFEADFKSLQNYTQKLSTTATGLLPQRQIFTDLQDYIPTAIRLTDLTVRSSELKISGQSDAYVTVSDFVESLTRSGKFSNVEIISVGRQDGFTGESSPVVFTIGGSYR